MFGRRLVDREVAEWQFDGFAWLIDNFEQTPGLQHTELWLPVPEHFPDTIGQNVGPFLFQIIKEQCGFNEGDIFELEAKAGRPDTSLGGLALVQTTGQTACGTYQMIPAKYGRPREIIRYDKSLESRPSQLIATFAHELGHALHNRAVQPLDEPAELYELFTDLTAVFLGYGVFLANSRFEFSQFSNADMQGWQASGAGYLPEADLIFATALFMAIKSIPASVAMPHLKPRLRKQLKKAFRQLEKLQDEVDSLRNSVPLNGNFH